VQRAQLEVATDARFGIEVGSL